MDYQWEVFKGLSRAGLGSIFTETYIQLLGDHQLPEVSEEVRERDYNVDNGKVLLPMVQGENGFNSYLYCLLAHAFRVRGYEPIIPICLRDLPICMRKENHDDEAICDRCTVYTNHLLESFGLSYIPIHEIEVENNQEVNGSGLDVRYRGVEISKYAEASTRRFVRKYHLDLNDEYENGVYHRFLSTAKKLVDITHALFEDHEFAAVVSHDPAYVYGGIFLEMARQAGVPARSVDIGYYRDKTIMVGNATNRSPLPQYTETEFVDDFLSKDLSSGQESRIMQLVDERMSEDFTGINYSRSADESYETENSSVYGLFTNLVWDGSLTTDEESCFTDPFAWVDKSIQHASNSSYELVIKTHPAEFHHETNESMAEYIQENHNELPDNVTILPPETEIDPYQLMRDLDLVAVWNSTIGLESALCGLPVVVAGDTHYRGYGFTFDPESPAEYVNLLKNPPAGITDSMRNRAKRYGYLLFEKKLIDFPYFDQDEDGLRLLPCCGESLELGNQQIDMLILKILEDEPVLA